MNKKIKAEYSGWYILFTIGTFTSIFTTIYLYGGLKVNWIISIIPMILWVSAYELSKKINKDLVEKSKGTGGKDE